MSVKYKAVGALLSTIFLWSSMVVVARYIVGVIHPFTLLFFRLLFAVIPLVPILWIKKPWKKKKFGRLLLVSLLTTVNVTFFLLGIGFTSASASQLIYAAVPVLILVLTTVFYAQRHPFRKYAGVLIGIIGLILIIYLSALENGTTITGSLYGNFLVIIAMLGWTFYVLTSKSLQKNFSAMEISGVSLFVSFLIAIPLCIYEIRYLGLTSRIDGTGLFSVFYIGFFGTFLPYFLYQYGLRHVSALTASFTTYIQPIVTAILEIIFLGAVLTRGFIIGSSLVFVGVFLATTLEFLNRRK